jgi:nicotinamide mononucleotide (NMN) deamidase PncC
MQHLGDHVYAEDSHTSLEDRVIALLRQQEATLGIAEVGTGGALTAALQQARDSSTTLAGAFIAPSEEQLRRLIGSDGDRVAGSLAEAAGRATGGTWVITVGAMRRDASGRQTVVLAIRKSDGSLDEIPLRLHGSGPTARSRLVTSIVDRLRRQLREER